MITYNNDEVRLYGLSTDAKPTDGIENGTTFVEIDTSDQYYFNEAAGTWVKKNSSVGGGLPTPTAADSGKAVVVSALPTDGAVIVPEQSVISDGSNPIAVSGGDVSAFVVGAGVIATINGVKYTGTLEEAGEMVGAEFAGGTYFFGTMGGEVLFGAYEAGEHTVKLSARGADSVGYGFGGSALLVRANNLPQPPESGTVYTFPSDTAIDASYNAMKNALLAGRTVTLIASMSDGDGEMIYALGLVSLSSFDGEYNVTFTAYDSAEMQYFGFFTSYDPDDPMTC